MYILTLQTLVTIIVIISLSFDQNMEPQSDSRFPCTRPKAARCTRGPSPRFRYIHVRDKYSRLFEMIDRAVRTRRTWDYALRLFDLMQHGPPANRTTNYMVPPPRRCALHSSFCPAASKRPVRFSYSRSTGTYILAHADDNIIIMPNSRASERMWQYYSV